MARRKRFTRAQLQGKHNRSVPEILADNRFQEELQHVRSVFSIPEQPTTKEWNAFYTRYSVNWPALEEEFYALDSRKDTMRQLLPGLKRLAEKYGVDPILCLKLENPFERTVSAALARLGLGPEWREFFLTCLAGHATLAPISPGYKLRRDAKDGTVREVVLRTTPYDSEGDVLAVLHRARDWKGFKVKVRSARPSLVPDAVRLQDYILEQAKQRICTATRDSRARHLQSGKPRSLLERCWSESKKLGLHSLSKDGFKNIFYPTLKNSDIYLALIEAGIIKQYHH